MSEKSAKKKAPAKKAAPKKAKKAEKSDEAPREAPVAAPKMDPSPTPNILSRHEGSMHERRAKGFSRGELASVGLSRVGALALRVPIDIRRRSTLQENVDALKGWYKPAPKEPSAPTADKPKVEKSAKPAKKHAAKKAKKE